jgi:MSHA biogenesis protein MshI
LAYVRAHVRPDGTFQILKIGVERQGADSMEEFIHRLEHLGLKGIAASAMLRTEQYHLLQIPAPTVPAEELKSAARYQIREMVDIHIDDLTLDVLHVGDGTQKTNAQIFVVAATSANVRAVMDLAKAMEWPVEVIDVQGICQRNLQTALAARAGVPVGRATAALVLVDEHQAMLTVTAQGELYYSRRLELPEGFLTMEWGTATATSSEQTLAYTPVPEYAPVGEYVPEYARAAGAATALASGSADSERAQRLVVEVQRSLDLWDRTWSSLPLVGLSVYAGERTADLAAWLSREIGQVVASMEVEGLFPGLQDTPGPERCVCMPLLGLLLRSESGSL